MPCRGAPLQSRVLQLILVLLVTAPWRAEALLSRRTPHSCDCPPPEPVASKGLPESPHRHPERAQPSSKQAHKIPRLVHQCWFPEATPLPARYLAWQRTWVTKHPEWEFWQWSDVSNRALVARHYPWLLETYDAFPKEIMRADFVRPLYLHRYGGLYLDLDMESMKPVDELLAGHSIVLAAIGNNATHEQSINNCFMASQPGESFWLFYIQAMHARAARGFQKDADFITGPIILRQALQAYRNQSLHSPSTDLTPIKVLASKYIFPNAWMGGALKPVCNLRHKDFDPSSCKALYPHAFAITYFAHSW